MSTPTSARDARSAQAARRKRKGRAAQTPAPELKHIVSGAGQPLDPAVRRELEETLGHDLSRVRLHTDRDAAVLTDMLGADAVAVGQEIFFREGAYQPGTDSGLRLLTHEVLHTVQNPDGLGALRAGRDTGAVSLPQQAIEQEAESAAQELASGGPVADVRQGQATPGWLRYATVDADLMRVERLDPATLVDRLANSVARSLHSDPQDRSKRVRIQLARLPDEVEYAVLERLEARLLSPEYERVLDLVEEAEADGSLELSSLETPVIEPDLVEELRQERETEQQEAGEQRAGTVPGPEQEQPGPPQSGGVPDQAGGQEQQAGSGTSSAGGQQAAATAPERQSSEAPGARSPGSSTEEEPEGEKQAEGSEEDREQPEQQGVPVASEEESAAKNRPGAVDSLVAGRQPKPEDKAGSTKPTGSPMAATGKDTQLRSAVSTLDGVRGQDLDGPEEQADKEPFGSGSESEVEAGSDEPSAWDIKLQPEDFLPEQDLDVSGVPTADQLDPSSSADPPMPSFPAPPPTKAEKVQAERDAEDAADAAEAAELDEVPEEAPEEVGAEVPAEPVDEGAPADDPDLLKQAVEAAPAPAPAAASKDPKSGADPKAGPVAAQVTVQKAPGNAEGGSDAKEAAAKDEQSGTAPEKESQQAVGSESAASQPSAEERQAGVAPVGREAAPAGQGEQTADSKSPSPARDTSVSGGSNADTPGRASGSAAGEAQRESPEGSEQNSRTAAAQPSAPAAPEPAKAAAAPAAAPEPEAAPAPKAAASGAAPAAKGPSGGGGGGGGGGGSAPVKGKKNSAPPPNLSQVSPEAGLTTASKLKPHVALEAMSGVNGSVDRAVGDEHQALASAPPSMERPAGAPQTREGPPEPGAPAEYSQDPGQRADAPEKENAEVTGAQEPEGEIPAEAVEEPSGWDSFLMMVGYGLGSLVNVVGGIFSDEPVVDAQALAASFAGLPTEDEALEQAQVGSAPGVQMAGDAQQTAGDQGTNTDTKGQETHKAARDDAARPMGEDQVYPNAPKEQLTANVPGMEGGGGGAPGGAATGAVPPEAASEVAEHERSSEFQAAFSEGQQGMSEGRQTKDSDFRDSQQQHKQQVDTEIKANTESQTAERQKALDDVETQRTSWRDEQDKELETLGTKKTERHDRLRTDVEKNEKDTDDKVKTERENGDKKIKDEDTRAKDEANKKRDDAADDSGNWVSRAFEWIKQKFIEIRDKIVSILRTARDHVVNFIKNFKENVERWINEARDFIVNTVKKLIDDLIQFVKDMVQAIIDLAKSIIDFITSLIQAAIDLVTELAQKLGQIVTDLLNALGKLQTDILNALMKVLKAALDAVVAAVKAVLDFAVGMLSALGEFMMIAVDFLSDPGGWLSGAKNSAEDSAKNHLFREVTSAVMQWFKDKIQEILGIPAATLNKLIKGGIKLEDIVKDAWEAAKPQLPLIIGEVVLTKVVAKLIPGAGWVMAVIDAIQTAIGALSEILRAIGAVITWLKAVRQGGAGILFAKAVAAGIVALLELAYEFLLSGIGKYVGKVGDKFKGIADNLGKDKGDKPGGKGPTGGGSDARNDNDGDKRRPEQAGPPRPPGAPNARPAAARPRPGTRPDAGRPAPARPGMRGQGEGTSPGRPQGPVDGRKPTANDKNGRPKKEADDRSGTRPTPVPKAEPKPKPQPKDDTPSKLKDDKDATRPRNDDKNPQKDMGEDPSRLKGQDQTRPRSDDKNGPGTPKPGRDSAKPTKPKDGDSKKPKGKDDDKDPKKPKDSKDKDGINKDKESTTEKQDEKDRRKKEEDSKESKDERLRRIVARIQPKIESTLRRGVGRATLRALLGGLRLWYRLSGLDAGNAEKFDIRARLNPEAEVAKGLKMDDVELADALDAMVAQILRSDKVTGQSRRIGPPQVTPSGANERAIDSDIGTPGMLRNLFDNPLVHRAPENIEVMAGGSSNNSRLTFERGDRHGGGVYVTEEGKSKGPSYRQENINLHAVDEDGARMGERILEVVSGRRGGWGGGNSVALNQAVLTSVLTTVVESIRTPVVLVPNIGAVNTSRLGGEHIGSLVEGLPLSGKAAKQDRPDKIAEFGEDSYEVIGGQLAGRQTEWLLAVRRATGVQSYFDTSAGSSASSTGGRFSTSGSVGTGYLGPVQINQPDHPAAEIAAITRQFQVPARMVQKSFNLEEIDKRVGPKLWKRVGAEVKQNIGHDIKPPSGASEEVLRRIALNMKLWSDAMNLDYSQGNSATAKGDFLVRIWHELTDMFDIPADSAFEQRLRGIVDG